LVKQHLDCFFIAQTPDMIFLCLLQKNNSPEGDTDICIQGAFPAPGCAIDVKDILNSAQNRLVVIEKPPPDPGQNIAPQICIVVLPLRMGGKQDRLAIQRNCRAWKQNPSKFAACSKGMPV
jgi:hypothetical protein